MEPSSWQGVPLSYVTMIGLFWVEADDSPLIAVPSDEWGWHPVVATRAMEESIQMARRIQRMEFGKLLNCKECSLFDISIHVGHGSDLTWDLS